MHQKTPLLRLYKIRLSGGLAFHWMICRTDAKQAAESHFLCIRFMLTLLSSIIQTIEKSFWFHGFGKNLFFFYKILLAGWD